MPFRTIVDIIINGKKCCCVFTVHIANVYITIFSKVSARNIFTFFQPHPELVLKLFSIFGPSEPYCSNKIVLIKKSVYCYNAFSFTYKCKLGNRKLISINMGRAWLAQLVRSLLSDHKVPSSIPGSAEI